MKAYTAATVSAAVVSVVLTALARRLALRYGTVEHPEERHIHRASIPRVGGLAIYAAFMLPLIALFFVESSVAAKVRQNSEVMVGILAGGLAICLLGALDDLRGVRARYKLAVQLCIASFAYAMGIRIEAVTLPFVGTTLEMGIFALPVTMAWIVGVTNAVNLIDGLDGLAAGVVFFAAVTNFMVAYLGDMVIVGILMAATIGSVFGFLVLNFNPARIFMGDSGSYFLGYVLATVSLVGNMVKASTTVSLLVPIIALGLPIFDTLFSMMRRFLERQPIFAPDQGHIHHRLITRGLTHRRAVLTLYGVSIVMAACALAIALGRNWQVGVAILAASIVLIGLVRYVGGFEYLLLRRRQKSGIMSRDTEQLRPLIRDAALRLERAEDLTELTRWLGDLCEAGPFGGIEVLEVEGRTERRLRQWTREPTATKDRRVRVSGRYPIAQSAGRTVELKFRWKNESGEVSPQADVLLRVLADFVTAASERLDVQWAEHGEGPAVQPESAREHGEGPSVQPESARESGSEVTESLSQKRLALEHGGFERGASRRR